MGQCIKHREVIADTWRTLPTDAEIPADGDVIVPLARWLSEKERLLARTGRTGVLLEPADEPDALAGDVGRLPLVAVNFPAFTDGRGYSTARLLRERFGYDAELRAVGDVLRDQIFYLVRCGFDAFRLRDDQDPHAALAALDTFSEVYQAGVDRGPLFDRRPASTESVR
ncbi:MAG: DUF934 domain-containing protein [Burkholderiales bacterium]